MHKKCPIHDDSALRTLVIQKHFRRKLLTLQYRSTRPDPRLLRVRLIL